MMGNPTLSRAQCVAGLLAIALALSSCSRVRVHSMTDPTADFSTYQTFVFLPKGGMKQKAPDGSRTRIIRDPLFHAQIQAAIEGHLAENGLRRIVEPSRADLLIGYSTAVKDQAEVMPAVYGVGWRGRVHQVHPARVKWYKEGTLVIDLIDRRGENLVWRGLGVGDMRDMQPGDELQGAVREIMRRFVPEK